MKKRALIGMFWVLLLNLVSRADRQDVKLSLTIPEYTLLQGEYGVPCTLRVTNMGKIPLPLCTYDFVGIQLKFDLGVSEYKHHIVRPDITTTKPWEYVSALAETNLCFGEAYDLDLKGGFYPVQEACAFLGATNITAYLLIGDNEWAGSNPCLIHVKLSGKDDSYWMKPPVFATRGSVGQVKGKSDIKLFEHTVDGRKFLFNNYHQRVCEVPDGESPEFKFDEKENTLHIGFPKKNRQLRYNTQKMKIESEE